MSTQELITAIEACIARYYCKIKDWQCIGKDTTKAELALKQLYIGWKIVTTDGYEDDGTIQCLLNKLC